MRKSTLATRVYTELGTIIKCLGCNSNVLLIDKENYRKQRRYCNECHIRIATEYKQGQDSRYSSGGTAYKGVCILCKQADKPLAKLRRMCNECCNLVRSAEFKYILKCKKEKRICIDCGSTDMHTLSRCRECSAAICRLKRYKLAQRDYNTLLSAQEFKCAICLRPEAECKDSRMKYISGLVVDHDHANNKVRGLLCKMCNTHLGWLEKDKDKLLRMVYYLHGTAPDLI